MSGDGGGGDTTQTQKLDPYVKKETKNNIELADEIASEPYQPYTGTGVVDFTGAQRQAQGQLMDVANSNAGTAPQQQAQGMVGNAVDNQAREVNAQSGASGINDYMSPYTDQVVNNTLDDIDRSRQMAVNQGQDQSLSAGAYDGSRSALADAETNERYAQQASDAAGQLRNQGWASAVQASQQDANRDMQAQQANQNADQRQQQLAMRGAGLIGNLGQQEYQNLINNARLASGVGDAQQQQQQRQADYDRQEWEREQGYDERMLHLREQALGNSPLINAGSTTQSASGGGGTNAFTGALGGAATGAAVGSAVPGWGTAAGAAVGGGAGLLSGMF